MLDILTKHRSKYAIGKKELVTQEWLDRFSEETKYTPDVWSLELSPWAVVFIHDDLKETNKSHEVLKDQAVKLADAVTREGFCYYNHKFADDGSPMDQPVALRRETADKVVPWAEQKGAPNAHISGELYRINSKFIKMLDTLYENGVQFNRQRVQVRIEGFRKRLAFKNRDQVNNIAKDYLNHHATRAVITSPITETYDVDAWMYIGSSEYWEDQLDAGLRFEPVQLVRNKKTGLVYYNYNERK